MNKGSFWNFTHKYDFFSQPFSFMMGGKIKRSTILGGILSLTIIGISISYFVYLMYNFFGYKIYPNVSNSIAVNDYIDLEVDYDFQMFQVLINGQSIEDYEKQMKKKYMIPKLLFEEYTDKTYTYTEINLENCDHEGYEIFKCIKKDETFQKIYSNSRTRTKGIFTMLIGKCINEISKEEICAPEEEIDALFSDLNNFFQFFVKIKQYNTRTRKYEVGFKSEYVSFDPTQVVQPTLVLKKATTQVSDGILIQDTESLDSVFEYQRFDSNYAKDSFMYYDQPNFKLLICVSYSLNEISNYVIIQHITITQVLAQFMSVFNSLLVIGIFAREFANKNIQSDIISILLADQYKEEAFNIVQQKKQKDKKNVKSSQILEHKKNTTHDHQKSNQIKLNLKKENPIQSKINQNSILKKQTNSKNNESDNLQTWVFSQQKQNFEQIDLKHHPSKKQQDQNLESSQIKDKENEFQNICEKHEAIESEDLKQAISQIMDVSTIEKIKQIFSNFFYNKEKTNLTESDPNNNFKQVLKSVEEQMRHSLNIYSIYKELIYLKRAIKIILTEDQYAALYYCTSLISLDPERNTNKLQDIDKQIELQKAMTLNLEFNSPLQSRVYQVEQDILLDNKQSIDPLQNKHKSQSIQFVQQSNNNQINSQNNNITSMNEKLDNRSNTTPHLNNQVQDHKQKKFIEHFSHKDKPQENQDQSTLLDDKLQFNINGDNQGIIQNESASEQQITKDLASKEDNIQNNIIFFQKYKQTEDILRNQIQNKDFQENHLLNMDIIDKNKEIRTKYLHQFIIRTSSQNIHTIESIDSNILNSLFK